MMLCHNLFPRRVLQVWRTYAGWDPLFIRVPPFLRIMCSIEVGTFKSKKINEKAQQQQQQFALDSHAPSFCCSCSIPSQLHLSLRPAHASELWCRGGSHVHLPTRPPPRCPPPSRRPATPGRCSCSGRATWRARLPSGPNCSRAPAAATHPRRPSGSQASPSSSAARSSTRLPSTLRAFT